jgi:anti-sigma factor ChrR (cupin superfamily)
MKKFNLDQMTKGWFVGDFEPTVIRTTDCEVGVKRYRSGDKESAHFHKEAVELTIVIEGRIRMNESVFLKGDIVLVEKNEIIEFQALEDTITVVYKSGSFKNDKYLVENIKKHEGYKYFLGE